ncbi:MAG: hypothetical protein JNJ99_10110, partial [Crocinitomicaceae bacterium]|nr:hypothetical protein [Crocinitomicaceae bacterium]
MQKAKNRITVIISFITFLFSFNGLNSAIGQDTTNATIDSLIMNLMTDE